MGVDAFFDGDEYVARFDEFADAGETVAEIRRVAFAAFAEEPGHDPGLGHDLASGYADRFETVVHGGIDAPYKPDPEPFHLALDELDVDSARAVHHGNSLASDVRGRVRGEAPDCVGPPGGERSRDPNPVPHYLCETIAAVADEPRR